MHPIAAALRHLRPNGEFLVDAATGAWSYMGDDSPTQDEVTAAIHPAVVAIVTQRIKADRDRRKLAGTPVGAHVFHSDPDSRIQQIGLVMMGAALPAGIQWKTVGGAFVEMTPTLAGQIFQATAARDVALFAAAEAHIAAATAAADPLAYDYSAGWPA